jgi:hypothetical protein
MLKLNTTYRQQSAAPPAQDETFSDGRNAPPPHSGATETKTPARGGQRASSHKISKFKNWTRTGRALSLSAPPRPRVFFGLTSLQSMGVTPSAIATLLLLFHILHSTKKISAYRIKGSDDENKPFVPYEKGFVQNVQDPAASIANRSPRVNHGHSSSSARLGDGIGTNRLFSCPNMVGPFFYDDDNDNDASGATDYYFCTGDKNGYCDRRSGTCFCNEGYAGESCESCAYPTHFQLGGVCHPKRTCPNDCSHDAGGRCNYVTGVCECSDHRMGDDCSASKCSLFHQFCTHCNDGGCLECEEGWSVVRGNSPSLSWCEPCWRFDPRCRDCNADICTSCVDLLLLSIHRSGRRPQDPPLPIDELRRELSVTVPFGSQQDDAFYDAEHYFLVDDPSLVPLNESAVECHQGLNFVSVQTFSICLCCQRH